MTQNIPLSDTFDDYGGAYLTNYIRVVPSTTTTLIGAYAVQFGEGTLNSGYKAGFGGVSMTSTSSPVVADRLCCTSWRAFSNLTQSCEAVFKLATTSGVATEDSFRQCCVGVRVQGGTFDDTWQHERNSNVSGYFFLLVNTQAQGCLFQGIRINAGAVTVLGTVLPSSVGLPNNALSLIPAAGRRMKISVIGSGGNPQLSVYTSNADGSNEMLLGTLSDSSVSKITTAGRCLFGMTTDRLEAGSTKTATLCTYFRAVDDGPPLERLRDEWVRNSRHGFFNLNNQQANLTDANGVAGKRAQQHWIGDIYGQMLFGSGSNRIPQDVGNNRLKMPWSGSPPAGGSVTYLLSTCPPSCGKCLDKSIVVTYVQPAPDVAHGTTPSNDIRLYLWENSAVTLASVWISYGLALIPQWEILFVEASVQFSQTHGGSLGLNLNVPITYRWIVSVSGTAPTRLWKFECRVNGVQIPFTGTPANGWTLNGDGSLNWPEATKGALLDQESIGWCRIFWNGTVGTPSPDPFIDDTRIDTFTDTSPACCDITPLPDPVQLAVELPPVQLTVQVGSTSFLPDVTQLVVEVPQIGTTVQVGTATLLPDPVQQVVELPPVSLIVQVGTATFLPTPVQEVVEVPQVSLIVQVGVTQLLPPPVELVAEVPPLGQLLVITPTVSAMNPAQVVVEVPGVRIVTGNDRKDPAGQVKFAGPEVGEIGFAGAGALQVG